MPPLLLDFFLVLKDLKSVFLLLANLFSLYSFVFLRHDRFRGNIRIVLPLDLDHGFLALAFLLSPSLLPHQLHLFSRALLFEEGLLELPRDLFLLHLLLEPNLLASLHLLTQLGRLFFFLHLLALAGEFVLPHGLSQWLLGLSGDLVPNRANFLLQAIH